MDSIDSKIFLFGGDLSYYCTEEVKQKLMGHKGNLTSHYTSEKMKVLATVVEFVGTEIDFKFNDSLVRRS